VISKNFKGRNKGRKIVLNSLPHQSGVYLEVNIYMLQNLLLCENWAWKPLDIEG
jgi:hypothetical protein